MSLEAPTFSLAGAELSWPIGSAAGMTNHPDIEVVARKFEEYVNLGLGFVPLGSLKLGEASGGNAHTQLTSGSWDYKGGDEHVDDQNRLGYNAKGLPGPGVNAVISRIDDFVDLGRTKGVEVGLSLSPHTGNPIEETDELLDAAEKALKAGVLYVEFNLSCPNIPGRPPFYLDGFGLVNFANKVQNRRQPLINRLGNLGLYPKFGPLNGSSEQREIVESIEILAKNFGGIITSNTIGNQEPKNNDGSPAIKVNNGRAGMSGPGCDVEGRIQLDTWKNYPGEKISVLGISSGSELSRRLQMGATTCQLGSVLYWPNLISEESSGTVVERIKREFVDSVSST